MGGVIDCLKQSNWNWCTWFHRTRRALNLLCVFSHSEGHHVVGNNNSNNNNDNNNNNNHGPNGHLFYVGGDLMMRRGMLPIIMLPDGDLRIVLHLVPF